MFHIERWNESQLAWTHVRSFVSGPTALAVFEERYSDLSGYRLITVLGETLA